VDDPVISHIQEMHKPVKSVVLDPPSPQTSQQHNRNGGYDHISTSKRVMFHATAHPFDPGKQGR
jgi:hypothetical protein